MPPSASAPPLAQGALLLFNNNRDPAKVRRLMKEKLAAFEASAAARTDVAEIKSAKVDTRYTQRPPKGGLVVRVQAKILAGYEPTTNRWRSIKIKPDRQAEPAQPGAQELHPRGRDSAALQHRLFHPGCTRIR